MTVRTIMTADMAGFSRRMRADEESVIELLVDTYYALTEASVRGHGGRLFRREGDAVWCEFPTPQQALDASLELLEGVHRHNLEHPAEEPVALRVGVHTGPVTLSQGELFGQTLSQAKALESGGEIDAVHLSDESWGALERAAEGQRQPDGSWLVRLSSERREGLERVLREREAAPRRILALALGGGEASRLALAESQRLGGLLFEWEEGRALLILPADGPAPNWSGRWALARGEVVHHRMEGSHYEEVTGVGVELALRMLDLLELTGELRLTTEGGEAWGTVLGCPVYLPSDQRGEDAPHAPSCSRRPQHVRVLAEADGQVPPLVVGLTAAGQTTRSPATSAALARCPELKRACKLAEWALEEGLTVPDDFILGLTPRDGYQVFDPRASDAAQWLLDRQGRDRLEALAQEERLTVVVASPLEEGELADLILRLRQPTVEPTLWEDAQSDLGTTALAELLAEWGASLRPSPLAEQLRSLDCPILALFPDPRLQGRIFSPAAPLTECELGLLNGHALIWVCRPEGLPLLKDVHTLVARACPHLKPGLLYASDLPEAEARRWARRDLTPLRQLGSLVTARKRRRQAAGRQSRAMAAPTRPYKFLNYYSREDRSIFFGRDEEVKTLLARLRRDLVLVVFGKSGVGKTSLLRAGLLPHFSPPADLVLTVRVLEEPLGLIRRRLAQALGRTMPESLADGLGEATRAVRGTVILILDQFEEFFVRCPARERAAFVQALADLSRRDPPRCHLILSLREDFLAEMSEFGPTILNNRMRVQALSREQARQAVVGPARLFHLPIEEDLVEVLLDQLFEDGIDPPELQIVLDRLSAGELTLEHYRRLGGVRQILVGYLQETLSARMGPESRKARGVLKAMVTERGTKAVVTLDELAARLREPADEVEAVLQLLLESRLLRTLSEEGVAHYELAHDYLVQEVGSWQSELELASKHASLVLRSELRNFKRLGSMLPADRLRLIAQQHESLVVNPEERAFLLRASIVRGQDPTVWLQGGTEQLLAMLDDSTLTAAMQRAILGVLAGLQLDDLAVLQAARAARRVANPTLLAELGARAASSEILGPLAGAVRSRYFGPEAMAVVPAGPAWIGSSASNKAERKSRMRADLQVRVDTEADLREVDLPAFRIDRCLVTNSDYAEFRPAHLHLFPPEEGDHPAVNVSYLEACEYSAWLGKRMPSEPEWEKAARGQDGRLYPWGNEFDPDRLNSAETGLRRLTAVSDYPSGASPYGCLNMSGTVWEWTSTPWEPDSPLMAKKGGCTLNFEPFMQCSARFEDPPEMRLRWVGFRLAAD